MRKQFYIFLFGVSLFFSCAKETITEPDTIQPSLKIVYPLDIPEVPRGYPLCIKILISDNQSLDKVWLEVSDGSGYKKEYSIPGRSMEIIEKYYPPAGISGELKAVFFANDETGNTGKAEIKFIVAN